jgi:hypothetical protein
MGLKPVILSEQNWDKLKYQLKQDYPSSWILIREVMNDRLGFTVRRHTEYWDTRARAQDYGVPEFGSRRQPHHVICLDFYNEAKRTMFLLKYSDWIRQ